MRRWSPRAAWAVVLASAAPVALADTAASPETASDTASNTADDTADPAVSQAAEPAEASARAVPPPRVGYAALPGGLHAASAELLAPGTFELALVSGYGSRGGLLSADHSFTRAIGQVAVAYAPAAHVLIGLSFDGRYDKHTGLSTMSDDGYVGDPRLVVRAGSTLGKLALAGQLGVWVPGKDAPSIATSAISVDARALATLDAGFGLLSLDAGFRLDNSAKAIEEPQKLSVADQVSLGVSKWNAARGGVSLRAPARGPAYAQLEGSAELFVGNGAPDPILRGGAMIGVALSDAITLVGFVEAVKGPSVSYADAQSGVVPLAPYEPTVTGGVGLQARLGGRARRIAGSPHIVKNARPASVAVVETADVSGVVFDDAGKPVVGAKITVKLKEHTGTAVTDGKGTYSVAKLPIGKTVDGKTSLDDTGAEISAEVANKKPGAATLTLAKGSNAVPPITLDSMLPPGQLRAVITSAATSRPIAGASVAIEPGGATATSGPDGKFTIDLAPGRYKLTVTARGMAQQQLDVNIEQNGVSIKNIELRK